MNTVLNCVIQNSIMFEKNVIMTNLEIEITFLPFFNLLYFIKIDF